MKVEKLYVRFFDVDWQDGTIVPKSDLIFSKKPTQKIVPTIFITNRTLKNSKDGQINDMAHKISNRIKQKAQNQKLSFDEVQIDCDWSASTQHKYFSLLKKIRNHLPPTTKLSCTLRLHQLKYPNKTGVPPVDASVLMYYNMGNIDGSNTDNSILDNEVAKPYLKNLKYYPIPLDFALPIYNWLVIQRAGKVVQLINEVPPKLLEKNSNLVQINPNTYQVKESHYFRSEYLYKNDILRLEMVSFDQLKEATHLLKPLINQKKTNIIFYHLDITNLNNFPYEKLKDLADTFGQ